MNARTARLLLAVFVTPLLPALAFGILGLFSRDLSARGVDGFMARGLLGYGVALTFLCVLGLPGYSVARHLRMDRWWVASLAGSALALAATTTLQTSAWSPYFIPVGAISGALFWLIAS